MVLIADINFVSADVRDKLANAGVKSLADLAVLHISPKRCFEISQSTGLSLVKLHWIINIALFNQVHGIGINHSALLLKIGIDSVEKLAKALPENLLQDMREYNRGNTLLHILPSLLVVSRWVEEAQNVMKQDNGVVNSLKREEY